MIDIVIHATPFGSKTLRHNLPVVIYSDSFVKIFSSEKPPESSVSFDGNILTIHISDRAHHHRTSAIQDISELIKVASLDYGWITVSYNLVERRIEIDRSETGFQHGYYWHLEEEFIFSTSLELLARFSIQLAGLPHNISYKAIALYLLFQYLPSPYTMFEHINQVPLNATICLQAGRQITVRPKSGSTKRLIGSLNDDLESSSNKIINLVKESLIGQLDFNKSIAVLLSGGIDTSTIASLLHAIKRDDAIAFTATFSEVEYDESSYARLVADRFGLKHENVKIEPSSIESISKMARAFENPIGDRAVFAEFVLFETIRSYGISQVVTGECGDELLGYPRTRDNLSWLDDLPSQSTALAKQYLNLTALASEDIRTATLAELGITVDIGTEYLVDVFEGLGNIEPFDRLYFTQWKTWMIDNVYMKDRNLARYFHFNLVIPFGNDSLIEYLSALSTSKRKPGLHDKQFLKYAQRDLLPYEILTRPKHKFWLPFREWFRSSLSDYLHETLMCQEGFVWKQLGSKLIKKIIDEHMQDIKDHNRLLWALLFLDNWYHEFAREFTQKRDFP